MTQYDHLIVGGGMAGDAAIRAIRERRPNDSIGLISADHDAPYNRPPLSKALWTGGPENTVSRGTAELTVEMHLDRRATALDTAAKTVTDEKGETYTYGKLLLATGGRVRTLPDAPDGLIYYRTLADYRQLRVFTKAGTRVAVIGGGFIGSEIAAGLSLNEAKVTMIFPEDNIGAHVYPAALANYINDYFGKRGVDVLHNDTVSHIEKTGDTYRLSTKSGKQIEADLVVVGIGITPDTDLAESAGISIDNGITVDGHLRTSAPDVYAAGDVANFPNVLLGYRTRVEHADNADSMGAVAGANMAGEPTVYDHLPMVYSDLFDLSYEAVGELDVRHETVEDWKKPYEQGVIYYLADGRVRGVLLMDTWGQLDNARALIAEPGPFTTANVKGRLPK